MDEEEGKREKGEVVNGVKWKWEEGLRRRDEVGGGKEEVKSGWKWRVEES